MAPPVEPNGLSVTAVSSSQCNLSWNNGEAYDLVNIQRSISGGGYSSIYTAASKTTHSDMGRECGTTHAYKVRGFTYASGDWSAFCASAQDNTSIAAPDTMHAGNGDGQHDLTWNNNESTYQDVEIYRDGGHFTTTGGGSESHTDSNVQSGKSYAYKCRGRGNDINSNFSNEDTATIDIDPPTSFTATADGSNVDLAWTNGESDYDNVEVYRDQGSYATLAGGATTYEDTSASANTQYDYKVRGKGPDTNSTFTSELTRANWSSTLTDTCTATDTCSVSKVILVECTDTCNVTDSVSTVHGALNTITDTCTTSDSCTTVATYLITFTDTVTCTDQVLISQTLHANYKHYLGSSDGKAYEYDPAQTGDAGENIVVSWRTKTSDFSDQNPKALNHFKTVYRARVTYKDLTASTPIQLQYSTDGGYSWTAMTAQAASFGDGDDSIDTAWFFTVVTDEYFDFRVISSSSSTDFQLLAFEVFYTIGGEVFPV